MAETDNLVARVVSRQSHEYLGARDNDGNSPRRMAFLARRAILGLIGAYQLARLGRVSPCRFTPTCSEYAKEAIERHGAGHGVMLALKRLCRCRPGGPSGYDPIPE